MGWKQFTNDYLRFTKKERLAGLIVLLSLSAIFFIPAFFSSRSNSVAIVPNSILKEATDTLQARSSRTKTFYTEEREQKAYNFEPSERSGFTKGELFRFDPNNLSVDGWQRLGLNERTSKTILKYRNKGGKFHKPEDLKKIWGLPQGFYERVASYIQMESNATPTYKTTYNSVPAYERKERTYFIADVNSTDTAALIALPGIGSKLAGRITTFRDRLGGFHSVEQIAETYGLPDSTFQKIKPYLKVDITSVKKLNINTATKDELKVHPYVKWNLANAIVEYRTQHGAFKSLGELKNIVLIDDVTFSKIVPYFFL